VRRERVVLGLVEQRRLLVDDEIVDLVDDQDGLAQVEVAREDVLVEEEVVLLLEAVADVGRRVDRLVAREAE